MHKLYWHLLVNAVIAFGGLAILLLLARFKIYSDVIMVIFFTGAVGAVVNNYYRLAALTTNNNALQNINKENLITIQMYVSMLMSGILAFVCYTLFLSGLVQGSLFPVFARLDLYYINMGDLLLSVKPVTNIDTTKAILWAFIAGFSEKFVPNIIDTLAKKPIP